MIIDYISNKHLYSSINERINTGLEYLANTDFTDIDPGKYEIDGDKIFAIISEYETKNINDAKWEGHRKYIDIQYISSGSELIGYSNIKEMKTLTQYDEQKDKYNLTGEGDLIELKEGMFGIYYPEDIHMPSIKSNEKSLVKKVVVKILI